MRKNRNKELDIKNTKRILNNLPVEPEGEKNWLGHGDGGAVIDKMLLKGATMQELFEEQQLLLRNKGVGRKHKSSIYNHIRHLKGQKENEHGLLITDPKTNRGVYRFNYSSKSNDIETIGKLKSNLENNYHEKLNKIKETERESIISQRVGQNSLRELLLQLYENKCAMCDVDAVKVLRASHIVPWSEDKNIRLEPTNAILLCGLHDLAFDKGLIIVNADFTIFLPNKPDGLREVLGKFTHDELRLPASKEYHPKTEYLQRHKDVNSK